MTNHTDQNIRVEVPFSPACERNKQVIGDSLAPFIESSDKSKVQFLELGFGTLQHALYLCERFPSLLYFATDQKSYHPIFEANRQNGDIPTNLYGPYLFEARQDELLLNVKSADKSETFDFIFSANTLHIMGWEEARSLLLSIGDFLSPEGLLFLYGPFNFEGRFTSESNQNFDLSLKERNPQSGIRDFEAVRDTLIEAGLNFVETTTMPANNFILTFSKP